MLAVFYDTVEVGTDRAVTLLSGLIEPVPGLGRCPEPSGLERA